MTRLFSFHSRSWHLTYHLSRTLLVLALGSLCLEARAAPAPSETSAQAPSPSVLFTRACDALETGDLDGAASHILTLRQTLPESPEPRLLESLLALRRTKPALGWRDAFIQAWNDIGRPDFRESSVLPEDTEPHATGPSPEDVWKQELSAEQRFLVALTMKLDTERAHALIQQLPVLAPAELIVPIAEYIERDEPPAPVRARLRAALRARLAALSADYPKAMQLRALLLLEGTDTQAPFTAREIQELEALSQLPDWRQSDFLSINRYALRHFEATGISLPENHAYTVAVMALVSPVPWVLQKRTDASRDTLTPAERQRLGEALWRIGSRLSAESSIVELLVGLNLMKKAATELGDTERLRQATERSDDARASYRAVDRAAPFRWPLPSLRKAMIEASMSDEVAHMHAFREPEAGAR
ncbi:MAG TPA: hypothetical protein VFZ09_18940 [Archangium sp.]|uniref:hypothetical protein n=1 Tax=Archangium sp. TaxID=1872627 RepID=UPI002E36F5A1|nr:hypothetical protein [Archangium sp.]HEX5748324.1 hypothetical protein [Archangium sp.]